MKKTSAYCGLYCDACPNYIKTMAGEHVDEPCMGCRSETLTKWCTICNLKACAIEKGIDFCSKCTQYPCTKLMAFKEDDKYPYHDDVIEHLVMIAYEGEEGWREKMDSKYRDCQGQRINWYEEIDKRNN